MSLKNMRIVSGFSQSDLAIKTGISKRTIQHYEQGSRSLDHAKLETLCDIAIALNCNIVDLLENKKLKKKVKEVIK